MRYIFAFLVAAVAFTAALSADAATSATSTSFDIRTIGVSTDKVTKDTLFMFQPTDIVNGQNIAYWKVRSYCDMGMELSVNMAKEDHCGTAVTLPVTLSNSFSILYDNRSNIMKEFSFKLKAYDRNGKWLHTVTRNYRW